VQVRHDERRRPIDPDQVERERGKGWPLARIERRLAGWRDLHDALGRHVLQARIRRSRVGEWRARDQMDGVTRLGKAASDELVRRRLDGDAVE
jgi:hypothetical protein